MLILTLKRRQAIVLQTSDGPVTVIFFEEEDGNPNRVKVGVKAPREVKVLREGLL